MESSCYRLARLTTIALCMTAWGCGNDVEVGANEDACESACSGLCARMKECNVGDTSSSCTTSCLQDPMETADCQTVRSQLPTIDCTDMKEIVDCSSYCEAFCQKAASCDATVDQRLCRTGCAKGHYSCDANTLTTMACPRVAGELSCYSAKAKAGPNENVKCANSPMPGGTEGYPCSSIGPCATGLVCIPDTQLCGPCTKNEDCNSSSSSKRRCGEDHRCQTVECLINEDCSFSNTTRYCSPDTFKCVSCLPSLCKAEGLVCGDSYDGCVECMTNTDCASKGMVCDTSYNKKCVECLESTDCEPTSTCDSHRCWKRCEKDEQCDSGRCGYDHCLAPVGTPCDADNYFAQCGGSDCLTVDANLRTVDGYCSRSCDAYGLACPTGFVCKDYECRKQ